MGPAEGMPSTIKKALVTGGGGFVGKAIARNLVNLGIDTRVVGRHNYPDIEALGVESLVGDISDPHVMVQATEGVDVVFHVAALAGIWGPWQAYNTTNVVGTERVLEGCRVNKVPMLVYTSTPSVVFSHFDICGEDERLPHATSFLCNYAKSKAIAETMVLEANTHTLRTCALRPHLIWGPGDPHLLPRLLARGRAKQLKRVGDGENLVDISYIDNVVHAHILAAHNLATLGSASGKAYFISQGKPVNLWKWINDMFEEMGVPTVEATVSLSFAYLVGAILEKIYLLLNLPNEPKMTRFLAEQLAKSHYFSIDNARRDFGYEPIISSEEGMWRTLQYLKKL